MTCQNNPRKGCVNEDGGATFMARVLGNDGNAITQAAIQSILVNVFDLDATDPTVVVYTANLVVSTSVFDTLQLDARWTEDTIGYNFRHDMPASVFLNGNHNYRIEYRFTPTLGEIFWALFEVFATAVYSAP